MKGQQVAGLPGGDGCWRRMEREQPEPVLMDIQLPGKDGFTPLGEVRASTHRDVLVLTLTAHAMSGDRERALEAGGDGDITKPIDIRSFPRGARARARRRTAGAPGRIHHRSTT